MKERIQYSLGFSVDGGMLDQINFPLNVAPTLPRIGETFLSGGSRYSIIDITWEVYDSPDSTNILIDVIGVLANPDLE
jgi:hypothetical protein